MSCFPSCALLVLSCDPYNDLWTPYFTLLERHWPDRPFQVYLGAGTSTFASNSVKTLHSNAGRDWSQCLIDYLDQLDHSHVLIMLDDFFIRYRVNNELILNCLAFSQAEEATQLRLIPRPRPTRAIKANDLVGICDRGSPYRLSTQAAIWDRKKLRSLLCPGESIWDFEHNGNARISAQVGGFYSVWRPVIKYEGFFAHHVVEKGRWFFHEKWIFSQQKIGCDFTRRSTLGISQTIIYHLAQLLEYSLQPLSWKQKMVIKQGLKRMLNPLLGERLDQLSRPANPTQSRDDSLK